MLRYKPASEEDIMFMNTFDEMNIGIFCNEVYLPTVRSTKKTSPKHIHHHHRLSVKDWGGKLFHHSQKSNDSATTPQKQQPALKDPALEEAMLPSQEWIDVGSGNNGKLFLEVIACDDLPNLDAGTSITKCNMNDTFCCLVLEDSIVNTSYIKDSLSPRWQPDDRRAFIFHMHQPSSPLLIGVFDYDKVTVVSKHMTKSRSIYDAVGRVIVNLTQFCPNTIYTLHYELYEADIDSCITREQQQHRGTLTIRLRIKWGDQCCGANESRNMLLSGLMPPQNFYVSLPHREDFQTAHYTTSAEHDTAVFSMKILTAYIAELMDYIDDDMLGMILDAVSTVLLWRGHWKIPIWRSHFTINLPLHSMTAFTWGVLVTQDYNRFPAFLAFCIAWFFLATMEYRRNHPSPWHRCKSYGYLLWTLVAGPLCCCNGGNSFESATIQANENLPAVKAYLAEIEERKAEKARRKQATLDAAQVEETLLNKEMELDLGLEGDVKITSERKTTVMLSMNPLKPILYPVQQILAHVCIYLRIVKSIITWEENYYAFWIVTVCFLASLLMFFVPWGWILRWVIRLAVWVFLGPWMKIVDWLYFEKLDHMTEEERKEILRESLHTKYEHTVRERSLYQERKERALKLKSMMRYLFGKVRDR